mgnify:FL=1
MENVYNTIETQLGPLGPVVMAAIILGITYIIAKLVSACLSK